MINGRGINRSGGNIKRKRLVIVDKLKWIELYNTGKYFL